MEVALTTEGQVQMSFGTWDAANVGHATVKHRDFTEAVMTDWIADFVKRQIAR